MVQDIVQICLRLQAHLLHWVEIFLQTHCKAKDLDFKLNDICKPIAEKLFDIVICFETIENLPDYKAALLNMQNVLSRNGLLIVSSPKRRVTEPYLGPDEKTSRGHDREFTPSKLVTILQHIGFVEIDYFRHLMQICFDSIFIEKHFKLFFKPRKWSSQFVYKVRYQAPEYFSGPQEGQDLKWCLK